MTVTATIGVLADSKIDPEEYESRRKQFQQVSQRMEKAGLPPHAEPDAIPVEELFGFDIPLYGHPLRRFAAWIALHDKPPEKSIPEPTGDQVYLPGYYDALEQNPDLLFQHLIDHADAEGYYVPTDFVRPLPDDEETALVGGPLGSVNRLLAECEEILRWLEIPREDAEELLKKFQNDVPPVPGFWQRLLGKPAEHRPFYEGTPHAFWHDFAVETEHCLYLMELCKRSLKTGSAICFV